MHKFKIISALELSLLWTEAKKDCDLFLDIWKCPIKHALPILPIKPFEKSRYYYELTYFLQHVRSAQSPRTATDPMTRNPLEFHDLFKKGFFFKKYYKTDTNCFSYFKEYSLAKQELFKDRHPLIADKMVDYLWPEEDWEPIGIIPYNKKTDYVN